MWSALSAITWPDPPVRITRFGSLTESQFFGCVSAFVDSLSGELNSASAALRRLEHKPKGAAFAFEMTLDRHRYGAAIVLDRWAALVAAFRPHLPYTRAQSIVDSAAERVRSAETLLEKSNHLIDGADAYAPELVEACLLAFQSIDGVFAEERRSADDDAKLGPMLPEEYTAARRIFLEDLAHR
jgi:hypothetical protein